MKTSTFDLHGIALEVSSDDGAVLEAIEARLSHFRQRAGVRADIVFEYRTVAAGRHTVERPSGEGRSVYDPPAGEVVFFPEEDVLYVDYEERVRVRCEPARGLVEVSVAEDPLENMWLLSRPLFTLPLVETLKRRGLYSIHAAGVARGGGAIVFPGTTGAGKTTLAVALAKAGFELLADDMVFVAADASRVFPFPDELDVDERTLAWFPELEQFARGSSGGSKKRLDADSVSVVRTASLPPSVVLFPRITTRSSSTATPIDAAEALQELAPNVLLTDNVASQRHLSALGGFVARCPCYRLESARDFGQLAGTVAELAASATSSGASAS